MHLLTLPEYLALAKRKAEQNTPPLPPSKLFNKRFADTPEITYGVVKCCGQKATVYYYTEVVCDMEYLNIRFVNHYQVLFPCSYYISGVYDGDEPFLTWLYEMVECKLAFYYSPPIKTMWQEVNIFQHSENWKNEH